MISVSDPDEPEALTFDLFAAAMIDRRQQHAPSYRDQITKKPIYYDPPARPWTQVRGITLHQTACDMGERIERYDTTGAHFVVLRSGRVIRLCDENRTVVHGHGWNAQCVGIEINGLYPGLEDDPDTAQDESLRTTWDDPTTPTRERPMQVTPHAMRSSRQLVRWIVANAKLHGGTIKVLCSHRQSSHDRRNDPGEAIWQAVALPLHAELELTDGGVGFQIGGSPNPEAWDPRCKGIPY